MKRKCAVCGREAEHGYVWEGTDFFCSRKCVDSVLGHTTVEIMLDDDIDKTMLYV